MIYDDLIKELEEVLSEDQTDIGNDKTSKLVVYNDDFNTFDWVIESFMEICKHTLEQAEQLSLLVHYKGQATVKTGARRVVKPMKDALVDRGLSAVVEEV